MALVLKMENIRQDKEIASLQQTKVNLTTYNAAINAINGKIDTLTTNMEKVMLLLKHTLNHLLKILKMVKLKHFKTQLIYLMVTLKLKVQ